jgi:hypothetical protein
MPRSTPTAPSRVFIPKIDARQYQEDPVGAGLDSLQQVLQFGIGRALEKQDAAKREAFTQAEAMYDALEAGGIEKNEWEMAEQFRKETGFDISAVTQSHRRRMSEVNGRIRATRWSQEMEDKVKAGTFTSPEEFQKYFDDRVSELDKETDNAHLKNAFITMAGDRWENARGEVFTQTLARRKEAAMVQVGDEFRESFEDYTRDTSEEGTERFQARIKDIEFTLRKNNPHAKDSEIEAVYLNVIQEMAADTDNVVHLDETAEFLKKGDFIKTPEGRRALAITVDNAEDALFQAYSHGTIGERATIDRYEREAANAYLSGNMKEYNDYKKRMIGLSPMGRKAAHLMDSQLEASADVTGVGAEPTPEELTQLQLAMLHNDGTKIRDEILTNDNLLRYNRSSAGKRFVEQALSAYKSISGGGIPGLGDQQRRIYSIADEESWNPNLARSTELTVMKRLEDLQKGDEKLTPSVVAEETDKIVKAAREENTHQQSVERIKAGHEPQSLPDYQVRWEHSVEEFNTASEAHDALTASWDAMLNSAEPVSPDFRLKLHKERTAARVAALQAAKKAEQYERDFIEQQQLRGKFSGLTPEQAATKALFTGRADDLQLINQIRRERNR